MAGENPLRTLVSIKHLFSRLNHVIPPPDDAFILNFAGVFFTLIADGLGVGMGGAKSALLFFWCYH